VQTITSAVTLGYSPGTDYVVLINYPGGTKLPSAANATNNRYSLKNITSSTITITTTGSQTIDGSPTKTLAASVPVELISDGSRWRIL
jgi:hypothetical protein